MVYAVTESEKEQWMNHLCRCVENLLKRKFPHQIIYVPPYSEGGRAASDHAAVWVPDSEAARCMCCRSTTFTVIQRRVSDASILIDLF